MLSETDGMPSGADQVPEGPRRTGVVGSPVAHSLSPVLHGAAYAAMGLAGWRFDRAEVRRGGLRAHLDSLGPEWVGLSVTMPGKEEALTLGNETSEAARSAGAANTLVRRGPGWFADNTDIHGLVAALREAGVEQGRVGRALVTGGGATARSTLLALEQLGADRAELRVRNEPRPETRDLLARLRLPGGVSVGRLTDEVSLDRDDWDVVVGTLPGGAPAPPLRWSGGPPAVVMDVVYAPWPSPLATGVHDLTGGRVPVVRGTRMLLHQAVRQLELMTGRTPPIGAMETALADALTGTGG